jgi:uncharacterized membrane protein (DUF485 family)
MSEKRRRWPRTFLGRYFLVIAVLAFGVAMLATVMEVQRAGWGSVLIGWAVIAVFVAVGFWVARGES